MPLPLVWLAGAGIAAGAAYLFTHKSTNALGNPIKGPAPRPVAQPAPRPATVSAGVTASIPTTFAPDPTFAPVQVNIPIPIFAPPKPTFTAPATTSSGSVNRSSVEYKKWAQSSINQVDPPSPKLGVDGQIGPLSIAAIKHFQSKSHIGVDGKLGPQTDAALMAAGAPAPPGFVGIKPPADPSFAPDVDLDSDSGPTSPEETLLQNMLGSVSLPGVTILGTPRNINRSSVNYKKWVQSSINLVDPPSPKLGVDGQIGPLSIAAIKHFQSNHGLSPDGQLGPNTETALQDAGAPEPPAS